MKAIRSHYLSRRTSLVLVMVMVMGLALPCLPGAWAVEPKTVVVYPVAGAAENAPADLAERAGGALTMALDDIPEFDALQFLSTSPSVRRAVSEGRIRQVDVQEGTSDVATALSMGAALRADYIILATIQSYTRKDTPTSVELILSGQMYEVGANINPTTGEPVAEPKVFRAFGVSGASSVRAKYTGSENVLAQEALRSAALKAAQTLSGRVDLSDPTAMKRKPTSQSYKWVLLALLIGGLAVAVNSGGDGGGGAGPSPDALPPRNVAVEPVDESIRITWDEPTGTTLTVLRYQVERAVDGATFSRIDPGTLGPGTTSFFDFNTLAGRHVYQYRLRTVYTSGAISPYVTTGAIIVTR